MRTNLKLGFVLLLNFIFTASYGCSCVGEPTIREGLKNSQKVFVGQVIDKRIVAIDTVFEGVIFYQAKYTFRVSEVFKGGRKDSMFTLETGLGGGDCGYEFIVGQTYLVYANQSRRYFPKGEKVPKFNSTNICTRTTHNVEEERVNLNKVRKGRRLK